MAYPSPPQPLETIRATLHLPTTRNGRSARLEVLGTSQGSRASLWSYGEDWTPGQVSQGLEPSDTLHWLALIAWQDRPNTQFMLNRALQGLPCWEQGELPLGL